MKILSISMVILASLVFVSCSNKPSQTKKIDYTSPCACYEIIKLPKNKG